MRPKLIIDGNAVYEIDEGCMRRKRMGQGMEDCLSKKAGQDQERREHTREKTKNRT